MLLGGRVSGYMVKHVWTTGGTGKIQVNFCVTSWIDWDTDAMAYLSPKPSLSKVKNCRGKDWISLWPLGEGGEDELLTSTLGMSSGQHSPWESRQGASVTEPSDSSIAASSKCFLQSTFLQSLWFEALLLRALSEWWCGWIGVSFSACSNGHILLSSSC